MNKSISPKELSKVAGISASYASQILNGTRRASNEVALAAFRGHGVRLGLLAEMTETDLERLCAGRDGAACDHAQPSAPAAGGVSALKNEPDFSGFAHDVEISGGVVLRDAPSTGSVLSSPLDPVEGASLRPQDERTFDEGLSA